MSTTDPKSNLVSYNRQAWDEQVDKENRWTRPVSSQDIDNARRGEWQIVLTPAKPVPRSWFPDLNGCDVLCLASGGGQQGPILAAAGANVVVFDNSEKQLEQDRMVADRDALNIRTLQGDMAKLDGLEDQSFDLVFHPCSNSFVPDVLPVWKEAFRVLRSGGSMLSGFCNPISFIFDYESWKKGELIVRHSVPYSDLTSLTDEEQRQLKDEGEPFCFGHTLDDQIGGQISAGFSITGFYEDYWNSDQEPIDKYIASFVATKATK